MSVQVSVLTITECNIVILIPGLISNQRNLGREGEREDTIDLKFRGGEVGGANIIIIGRMMASEIAVILGRGGGGGGRLY